MPKQVELRILVPAGDSAGVLAVRLFAADNGYPVTRIRPPAVAAKGHEVSEPEVTHPSDFEQLAKASYPKLPRYLWDFYIDVVRASRHPALKTKYWNAAKDLEALESAADLSRDERSGTPLDMDDVYASIRSIEDGRTQRHIGTGEGGWNALVTLHNQLTPTAERHILPWDQTIHPRFNRARPAIRQAAAVALAGRYAMYREQFTAPG